MQVSEDILLNVGTDMQSPYGAQKLSDGIEVDAGSIILHGPYCTLPAGRYSIVVSGQIDDPDGCFVDAACLGGQVLLTATKWINGSTELDINLPFPASDFEIRVHAKLGVKASIKQIRLRNAYTPTSRRTFREYHRMGLQLILDETSLVDKMLIRTGGWEQSQIGFLRQMLAQYCMGMRDLVFLDIGAYFGLYSMIMAHTNMFDDIIAFEIDTLNIRQLYANLLINDPHCRIETHAVAVSDAVGEIGFTPSVSTSDGNRGHAGVRGSGRMVPTNKLDNLVSFHNRKIFAKIDVEGHELHVLRGMVSTLSSNRMLLQIETFDREAEVKAILEPLGYRLINHIDCDLYYTNF